MFDVRVVVAFNGAAVLLLAVVLINVRASLQLNPLDQRLFRLMVWCTIAQACIETLSYCIDGLRFPGSYTCIVVINDLLFVNNALFSFLWVLYVDIKLFGDARRLVRRYSVIGLPAMLIIAASFVNLFRPLFFRVDPETLAYIRTDIYFIPMLSSTFYLLYGFALTCKYRSRNNRYLFFPALIFMIPIMTASLVHFLFYGLNVLWLGTAISLTSIYVNLQNQATYTDSLSGLFTRQYMTACFQQENRKASSAKRMVGVMLDIDKFKLINDTYGHMTGDDAIRAAGRLLLDALPPGARAFRFGGDEFVLLQSVKDGQDAEAIATEMIERVRGLADGFNQRPESLYQLRFSVGYAVYDSKQDTFDAFLERMDAAMYQDKKNGKG